MSMAPRPDVTPPTRWLFAAGGAGFGLVLTMAQYYVLIYYSQVLGLSASLAGLAMAVALMVDAVSDPAVGFASDNWKSRWGRRHPFLYASILPILIFYLLLWFPPLNFGQAGLFTYLLVCIVGLRVALTLWEIPHNALVPELTSDYEERTRLFSLKETVSWVVGASLAGWVLYGVFFQPTPEHPDGMLNPEGYRAAARTYAPFILATLLISSFGLRRFIPFLSVPDGSKRIGGRQFLHQILDVLRVRSLRTMILAAVVSATSGGVQMVLWAYLYAYFWEVPTFEMSQMMVASALGAIPALYLLPRLAAGREKRSLAIGLAVVASLVGGLPIVLRLIGLFPANGSDLLFWVLMVLNFVAPAFAVMSTGLFSSMIADLIEPLQLATGRRPEGTVLAAVTFSRKAAWALGTVLAGILLDLAAFPTGAAVGEVSSESLFRFGLIYGPLLIALGLVTAFILNGYRIDRTDHEQAVAELGRREAAASAESATRGQ